MKSFILSFLIIFKYSVCDKICNDKIIDNKQILNQSDLAIICEKVENFEVPVFIVIDSDVSHLGKSLEKYYDDDSNNKFFSKCNDIGFDKCTNNVMMIFYEEVKRIRIIFGSNISKSFNSYNINKIILSMKEELMKNEYKNAILTGIQEISKVNYDLEVKKQKEEYSPKTLIVIVIIILILFIWIIYYCRTKTDNLVFKSKVLNEFHLYEHIQFLLKLCNYLSVDNSKDKCLICFESLNNNELRDKKNECTNSNLFLSQFNCGHYYHTTCISFHRVKTCMLCSEVNNYLVYVEPKINYRNKLSKEMIFCFISNIKILYDKTVIDKFKENYSSMLHQDFKSSDLTEKLIL